MNNLILVIFGVVIHLGTGVKINKLDVPEIVLHGRPVILDCDFTLEQNDQELVVKWFFNKTLVYQWIPGTKKRPQGLGILKGRLNLEYAASVDANSVHRALHILKARPDLSGDYTCSVSTLQSEDIETKSMLVLVLAKNIKLHRIRGDDGLIRVQCTAEGVFPLPQINLSSLKRNITGPEVTTRRKGQLYEVSAIVTLRALEDPEEFCCKLHISEANYTTRKETVFYPSGTNSARMISRHLWYTITLYFISTSLSVTLIVSKAEQMVTKSILKGSSNIPDDFRQIRPETFSRKSKLSKNQKKLKLIKSPISHVSENLSSLAEPKKRPDVNMDDSHWKVKNSTLKYKATKRIRTLAQPKTVTPKCEDPARPGTVSVSSVRPSALKYQPTTRILELARPKDWMYYEKYE